MAAPGKTVAAVNVRVLPKTDVFSPALKKYLDRVERTHQAKIQVDLDTTKATRKAAALVNTLNNLDTQIKVDVASDVGNLRAQGERAGAQLSAGIQQAVRRNPPRISPELDRLAFDAKLRQILAQRDEKIIEIDAEIARYRAKLQQIQSDPSTATVSVEADTLLYEARIRRLEATRHRVHVEANLDVDTLGARLRGTMASSGRNAGNIFSSAFSGAIQGATGILGNLTDGLGQVGSMAMRAGSQGAQGMTQLASGASSAAGPIGAIASAAVGVLVLGVLGVIASVAIPALIGIANAAIQAVGALGLIPGALAAVGGAFGAIAIGTMGVSDALDAMGKAHKASGGAAGSNAQQQQSAANAIANAQKSLSRAYEDAARAREDAARRVTAAETNLSRAVAAVARANVEADKRVQRATEDLTKARREAQRAMANLNREVRRGQLNQRRATLDVTQAQMELNEVMSDPAATQLQKELAQLSYDEAVASLDEVIARNQELGEEAQNAATKGVDGFESVISAQQALADATDSQAQTRISGEERVADAILQVQDAYRAQQQAGVQAARSIQDAQDSLRQAQQQAANSLSAGGKAANELQDALNNLSPSARKFVEQIASMRDRFNEMRRAIQEALFSGLDQKLAKLGNTYFPVVEAGLVKIAQAANSVVKDLVDMITEGENVGRISSILDNTARLIIFLGRALMPIVDAFIILADVGLGVLTDMAGGAEDLANKFHTWIVDLEKSGQLKTFFEGALDVIGRVIALVVTLGEAIGRMFISLGEGVSKSGFFEALETVVKNFLEFTKSDEGIVFFQFLGAAIGTAGKLTLALVQSFITVGYAIGEVIGWLVKARDALGTFFEAIGRIFLALSTMGLSELVIAAFKIDWAGLWMRFRDGGVKVMQAIKDGVLSAVEWVIRTFGDIVTHLLAQFLGLPPGAEASGREFLRAFGRGVKQVAAEVGKIILDTLTPFSAFFPHSPAKKGPFSGRGYTTYSGRALMRDFGLGIQDEAPFALDIARRAIGDVANAFDMIPSVPSFGTLENSIETEAAVTTQADAYAEALQGMSLEINAGTVTRFVNEKNRDNTRR